MKQTLKTALRPLHRLLQRPSIRYSGWYLAAQEALAYSPREQVLKTTLEYVAFTQLEGDYLEFGVYEGGTFVSAFYFAQRNQLADLRFYAFDSFAGLPTLTGIDQTGHREFARGEYACDATSFRQRIARSGVDLARVEIVPGWYDEVLNEATRSRLSLRAAAIVMVDCNLYESTVPVLRFVTDYVQDGTVVLFDDWFCFRGHPERGQRRAFTEWLQCNPQLRASEFQRFGWNGNSFILHRD